jgi:hypothetical protein
MSQGYCLLSESAQFSAPLHAGTTHGQGVRKSEHRGLSTTWGDGRRPGLPANRAVMPSGGTALARRAAIRACKQDEEDEEHAGGGLPGWWPLPTGADPGQNG